MKTRVFGRYNLTRFHHPNSTPSTPEPQRLHISKTHGRPSRTSNLPFLPIKATISFTKPHHDLVTFSGFSDFLCFRIFFWNHVCVFFIIAGDFFHLYYTWRIKKKHWTFCCLKKKNVFKGAFHLLQFWNPQHPTPAIRNDPQRTMDST